MAWSPGQYLAFEDERTRPVRDLVAAIPRSEARAVVDIGCGPGNSTEILLGRFGSAVVRGIDSSPEMLAAARQRLPGVRFDLADIEAWQDPGPFDVILANAVLQWLSDHEHLLPRLVAKLARGGGLALQMPDNLAEPALRLMRQLATDEAWADRLAGAAESRPPLLTAEGYYALLRPVSSRVDVWRTIYHHPIAGGAQGIVEWFKGSALRPYLGALETGERERFLSRYEALVEAAYPRLSDGTVLLAFPRLFVVATR